MLGTGLSNAPLSAEDDAPALSLEGSVVAGSAVSGSLGRVLIFAGGVVCTAAAVGTLGLIEDARITEVEVYVHGASPGPASVTEVFVEAAGTHPGEGRITEVFVEVMFQRVYGENRVIWMF